MKLTVSFDQSAYIRAAISSLEHEALWGSGLAILVILIFLASWSATGIIAVAIPLSIVATFVLLYFSGQTLNVFTLGGLALGVGRLVDDSIVELENIHRHLAMGGDREERGAGRRPGGGHAHLRLHHHHHRGLLPGGLPHRRGPQPLHPAGAHHRLRADDELLRLPHRDPHPLPGYLDRGGPRMGEEGFARRITRQLDRLDEAYARALRWVLGNRWKVIVSILVFFVASMRLVGRVGTEFFPPTDESQFRINFKGPVGTRVERTRGRDEADRAGHPGLARRVKADDGGPVARTIISTVGLPQGRTALFSANTGPHSGKVQAYLVPHTQRSVTDEEAADKVRAALREAIPGVQSYFFVGGIVKRILNFGAAAPIDIEIVGYDLEAGSAYAKRLLPRLRAVDTRRRPAHAHRPPGLPRGELPAARRGGGPREGRHARGLRAAGGPDGARQPGGQHPVRPGAVHRSPDRQPVLHQRAARRRRPQRGGRPEGRAGEGRRRHGAPARQRGRGEALGRPGAGEPQVPPARRRRHRQHRARRRPGHGQRAVEKVLDEVPPPEGFTVQLSGQTAAQREAFGSLRFAALMALALVYMILASQFKSLLDPLVIMFSVPLGVSGVFIALWLTGTTLNVNSFMGIIMMVGIVVSNGVLLVDFARVLRERGKPLVEATVEAGKTRLRPILMTTIATVAGLLPMALGIGEGSETNMPLARAVIGGLTVSTFFTLFLIPALYTLLARFEGGARRGRTGSERIRKATP